MSHHENSSLAEDLDNSTSKAGACLWLDNISDNIILLVICIIGIFGNVTVIFVILRVRSMRTATNALLINLAVGDLLVLLRTLSESLCELIGRDSCPMFDMDVRCMTSAVFVMAFMASLHTLMVLSIERFLAICKPLSPSTRMLQGKKCTALMVFVIWIFSGVLCFLFLGYGCLSLDSPAMTFFGTYLPIFNFLMVSIVMTVLYSLVIRKMEETRRSMATLRATTSNKEHKVAVLCLITAIISCICLLPYIFTETVEFLANFLNLFRLPAWVDCLHQIGDYFINANSAVNPYIYNIFSSRYRNALAKALGLAGKDSQGDSHSQSRFRTNRLQLQTKETTVNGAAICKQKREPVWV